MYSQFEQQIRKFLSGPMAGLSVFVLRTGRQVYWPLFIALSTDNLILSHKILINVNL